ncbi:MAG: hypothetical protein U0T56_11905 [Ferruginibacter sp.]
MTGTFKANNPINSFLLLAYGLLIKLPIFLYPQVPHAAEADGFFYRYLLNWLDNAGSTFPVIYSICAFILLYVQAMGINKLVNAQKLLPKPNYLPAMCYLLITSLFREWQILSAQLIMATLLVWILSQLSNLYNHPNAKTILFNTGMALGVATFFYFPGIAFTLLLVVGLSVTRPFKLPEWVVALLGMLAPAYFYGAWIFLTGQWESFKLPVVNMSSGGFHQTSWGYICITIILLAVVIRLGFHTTIDQPAPCSIPEMLEPRLPLPPGSLAHAPVNGFVRTRQLVPEPRSCGGSHGSISFLSRQEMVCTPYPLGPLHTDHRSGLFHQVNPPR